MVCAITASAQNVTQLNVPTTTTLWAGTQDYVQFGLSSLTFPAAGVILPGTAISQFTGQPERHLWYGDASNGFCRVDPEIDDPNLTQPAPGIGRFNNIITTCVGAIQAGAFAPMQVTWDATTNTLYAADIPRTANGVIRMHYLPAGDNGHGSIDPLHVESLMGNDTARNSAGGCPVVTDPRLVAQTPFTMSSAALGPDGNLYIGWMRNGSIVRIPHPATFDPNLDSECAQIQVVGFAPDARFGNGAAAGHTFGLAWIGHTMFGADNIAPWIKENFDQCNTPQNGFVLCGPTQNTGTEILGAFVPGPQAGIVSDFTYNGPNTTFPGNSLYAMTLSGAARIINATDVTNIAITPQFGGTFCFLVGGTVDTSDLANETFYAGVDCTQGAINGAAAIYKIVPQPPAGAPPGVPSGVTASNATPPGALAGTALVSWIPLPNGQATSGYVVRTVLAGTQTLAIPDTAIGPGPNGVVPTSAQITGLPLGTPVQFLVAASNTFGTSQFSIASGSFTAFVPTAPGAPTGVVATAGNASAQVAWSAPSSNGGLPITSYTVTAQLNGVTSVGNVTVPASQTGVNFTGLTNTSQYNFVVVATNAAGNSAASLPSNAVTPTVPDVQDISITMASPSSLNAGSFVTFTMTIKNNGPGDAPNVTLADTLPAPFVSFTTTQGACSIAGSNFSCTLGGMLAGSTATVKVTVAMGSSALTNSATVTLRDLLGNVKTTDPNTANNTASSTTSVTSGGGGGVTADIQIVGSAQNGGPAVGASDLFTWQIKNNTGNQAAPNVSFEATLPISFTVVPGSLSANQGGSCSVAPATGSSGQTLSCLTSSLAGGQTMIVTYNVTTSVAGTFGTTGRTTSGANDSNPSNNSFTVNIQPK
ncbi:MAG: DUF11 domain-containing protein [Acidobacteriia bacterium]|nr:DUF11 domain-containing protein [Terriglobia bacterium]